MALDTNQIYAYKLDGNSNESIASANGTDTSITYSAGNGKIVQGAGFNGSTSLIALPNNDWSCTTALSMQAWIKTTNTAESTIIGRDTGVGSGRLFQFRMEGAGANQGKIGWFRFGSSGSLDTIQYSAGTINDGNWHHIVITFSTSTGSKIYVDGSVSSTDGSTTTSQGSNPIAPVIGNLFSAPWNGAIDEVYIWNREITSGEVTQLYNSGTGLQYPYSVAYALAMAVGTFALTGMTALFKKGYGMIMGAGSFILTGMNINFRTSGWVNSRSKPTSTYTTGRSKPASPWINSRNKNS